MCMIELSYYMDGCIGSMQVIECARKQDTGKRCEPLDKRFAEMNGYAYCRLCIMAKKRQRRRYFRMSSGGW